MELPLLCRVVAICLDFLISFCAFSGKFGKRDNKVWWSVKWVYFQHRRNPNEIYNAVFSNSDNKIGRFFLTVLLFKYVTSYLQLKL